MIYQRIPDCPIEKVIDFIAEVNEIVKVQFSLYIIEESMMHKMGYPDNDFENSTERRLIPSESPHLKYFPSFLSLGKEFYPKWIKDAELESQKKSEENLGLTSRVVLRSGKIKHIPMVDFCCRCSEENLDKVAWTILYLRERKGFIIQSGKSYHYYGIELLSKRDWGSLMRRCKEHKIIDRKWIASQEQDGFSVLRISTSSRKPWEPVVVAKLGSFDF